MLDSMIGRVVLWMASGEERLYRREFAFPVFPTLYGRL
jgi:hypothetical protein